MRSKLILVVTADGRVLPALAARQNLALLLPGSGEIRIRLARLEKLLRMEREESEESEC